VDTGIFFGGVSNGDVAGSWVGAASRGESRAERIATERISRDCVVAPAWCDTEVAGLLSVHAGSGLIELSASCRASRSCMRELTWSLV